MMTIDASYTGERNYVFYILEKSLYFAVYLQILQLGVRMFVSELTESFQGISNKLLPGSMPAIDARQLMDSAREMPSHSASCSELWDNSWRSSAWLYSRTQYWSSPDSYLYSLIMQPSLYMQTTKAV